MLPTAYIKICIILSVIITVSNNRANMQFFRKLSLNHKGFSYKNSNTKKGMNHEKLKKSLKKVVTTCIQLYLLDPIEEVFLFSEFQLQSNLVIHNRN